MIASAGKGWRGTDVGLEAAATQPTGSGAARERYCFVRGTGISRKKCKIKPTFLAVVFGSELGQIWGLYIV